MGKHRYAEDMSMTMDRASREGREHWLLWDLADNLPLGTYYPYHEHAAQECARLNQANISNAPQGRYIVVSWTESKSIVH